MHGTSPELRAALLLSRSRPTFPYSIIPGGAYSAAELQTALEGDPVAARHYQVFRRSLVHMASANFSAPVFLSYRVGDAVYWTSRPVALPRGEAVVTDGKNFARARCGNRISPTPQTPVNDSEPAPSTLDQAKPPTRPLVDLETWSENRLISSLGSPFGVVSGVPLLPTTIIPGPGIAPTTETPPSWWIIGPGGGILYVPPPGLSPEWPPANPTGPVIQPNPIIGLVFPTTGGPGTLIPPGTTPYNPVTPSTPVTGTTVPPEIVPPFFPPNYPFPPVYTPPPGIPPAYVPTTPEAPVVPETPGVPGVPVVPGVPDVPNVPAPEPATLSLSLLALATLAAARLRRRS